MCKLPCQDVQSSQMVVKAKTSLLKGFIKLLNVLHQKRFAAAFCQNVQIANMCKVHKWLLKKKLVCYQGQNQVAKGFYQVAQRVARQAIRCSLLLKCANYQYVQSSQMVGKAKTSLLSSCSTCYKWCDKFINGCWSNQAACVMCEIVIIRINKCSSLYFHFNW